MTPLSKQDLRQCMKERRETFAKLYPLAKEEIVSLFFSSFTFPRDTCFGAYWPRSSEFDTRPLIKALFKEGFTCSLPCLPAVGGMRFRRWTPDAPLVKGKFNVPEPPPSAPLCFPSVLLVPLLAFDRRGYRLGYGRGDYDHYLATHPVLAMGIGYAEQEVPVIPSESHDIPLTYILTQEELILCHKS